MALNINSIGTSSVVTADGVIGSSGSETVIWSIETNNAIGAVYDGTGTGGTLKWVLAAGGSVSFPKGLHCPNGVYVDITGTGHVSVSYNQ